MKKMQVLFFVIFLSLIVNPVASEETSFEPSSPVLLSEEALQSYYDAISVKLDQLKKKIDALEKQQREFISLMSDIMINPEKSAPQEIAEYEEAMSLIQVQKFDLAINSLEKFVTNYPYSDRCAYAYYWLAEVCREKKLYDKAIEFYQFLIEHYPHHPKVPESFFKLSQIYRLENEYTKSAYQLKTLIQNYPHSAVTALAKKDLLELNRFLSQ